jgi:methyl-accepting chemotaxis protein
MTAETGARTSLTHEEKLGFFVLNPETRETLKELRGIFDAYLPAAIDDYYAAARRWPGFSTYFNEATIPASKERQIRHWRTVAASDFGPEYREIAETSGRARAKLGLETQWYLAGQSFIMTKMLEGVVEATSSGLFRRGSAEEQKRLIRAIVRTFMFDLFTSLSFFLEHKDQERRDERAAIAEGFEREVLGVVEAVAAAAGRMSQTAQAMSSTADATSQRSAAVAAAAEEATSNVTVVAASAEEMGRSVQEIAEQVTRSTHIAGQAVGRAEATNETIGQLSIAADKIGAVVSLISDIAEQTNLLALNATIESARAGEAGRGFAVVAAEVKSLATQTAKATEDIGKQIQEMQAITRRSVEAIAAIRATIDEINAVSASVSAAVEEQSAATQEIARSTQEAAKGTQVVSANIAQVLAGAQQTGEASGDVVEATKDLGRQAGALKEQVARFLASVRAA